MTATLKYADRAVEKLAAYLATNMTAHLREVESAQGLTASSLPDPVEVVRGFNPDDARSALVQVWADGGDVEDYANNLEKYDCWVTFGYAGDADIVAGQLLLRRWLTALIDCLRHDDGRIEAGVQALDTRRDLASGKGPKDTTRHMLAVAVEVHVYDA